MKNPSRGRTLIASFALISIAVAVNKAAETGYCIIPDDPVLCGVLQEGWDPQVPHTQVICSFGGVSITFHNGLWVEAATIYRPTTKADGPSGSMTPMPGPVQTSMSYVYSVSDCVQSVEPAVIYWTGCRGSIPDDQKPCP